MGYVAAKGGTQAVLNSEHLLEYFRLKGKSEPLSVQQIQDQMRLAVDRVMGEGALYAPELAALALKQSEGDTLEASFLLRAYRSTVPRLAYSLPAEGERMRVIRRISATFKDIPGGQILGPTRDYQLKLLNTLLAHETDESVQNFLAQFEAKINDQHSEGNSPPKFGLGYGFSFGHNEVKVMSMSIIDRVLSAAKESGVHGQSGPAADEEFVLLHVDGIESSGFTQHYKLPHYVSFQADISVLERARDYRATVEEVRAAARARAIEMQEEDDERQVE